MKLHYAAITVFAGNIWRSIAGLLLWVLLISPHIEREIAFFAQKLCLPALVFDAGAVMRIEMVQALGILARVSERRILRLYQWLHVENYENKLTRIRANWPMQQLFAHVLAESLWHSTQYQELIKRGGKETSKKVLDLLLELGVTVTVLPGNLDPENMITVNSVIQPLLLDAGKIKLKNSITNEKLNQPIVIIRNYDDMRTRFENLYLGTSFPIGITYSQVIGELVFGCIDRDCVQLPRIGDRRDPKLSEPQQWLAKKIKPLKDASLLKSVREGDRTFIKRVERYRLLFQLRAKLHLGAVIERTLEIYKEEIIPLTIENDFEQVNQLIRRNDAYWNRFLELIVRSFVCAAEQSPSTESVEENMIPIIEQLLLQVIKIFPKQANQRDQLTAEIAAMKVTIASDELAQREWCANFGEEILPLNLAFREFLPSAGNFAMLASGCGAKYSQFIEFVLVMSGADDVKSADSQNAIMIAMWHSAVNLFQRQNADQLTRFKAKGNFLNEKAQNLENFFPLAKILLIGAIIGTALIVLFNNKLFSKDDDEAENGNGNNYYKGLKDKYRSSIFANRTSQWLGRGGGSNQTDEFTNVMDNKDEPIKVPFFGELSTLEIWLTTLGALVGAIAIVYCLFFTNNKPGKAITLSDRQKKRSQKQNQSGEEKNEENNRYEEDDDFDGKPKSDDQKRETEAKVDDRNKSTADETKMDDANGQGKDRTNRNDDHIERWFPKQSLTKKSEMKMVATGGGKSQITAKNKSDQLAKNNSRDNLLEQLKQHQQLLQLVPPPKQQQKLRVRQKKRLLTPAAPKLKQQKSILQKSILKSQKTFPITLKSSKSVDKKCNENIKLKKMFLTTSPPTLSPPQIKMDQNMILIKRNKKLWRLDQRCNNNNNYNNSYNYPKNSNQQKTIMFDEMEMFDGEM